MGKTLIRILVVTALLALMVVLVPSATPLAIGEEISTEIPVYSPVTLEATEVEPIDYLSAAPYKPDSDAYLPDEGGYLDPSVSVRVEYMRAYDTTIQLTWVQVADASQLRTASYKKYPSKSTAYAMNISKREGGIVAINGDYFVHRKEGYIIRNGEVLRQNYTDLYHTLIIDDKGDFTIMTTNTQEAVESFEGNAVQLLVFGPALVIDGVQQTDFEAKGPGILKECTPHKKTQRLAICQMDELSYLIIATEGPENKGSKGLTMANFAQLCADLGVKQAFNLDGGSSSTVVLNDKKINSLSTGKKRKIGDILYFVTAVPNK
ncbi:MAG: phosphodiester glycosidase family protein [Clostridia bacterium]|nr:phosphodiester glycosidase family protein [Clostridia bacterium]